MSIKLVWKSEFLTWLLKMALLKQAKASSLCRWGMTGSALQMYSFAF